MQGHGGPIYSYVLVVLVGFLPWSPFGVLAIRRAGLRGTDDERSRFLRLFVTFGAITFVFFSIAATKLPSYIFPVFPTLALLTGDLLARELRVDEEDGSVRRGWRRAVLVAGVSLALMGVFLGLVPFLQDLAPALFVAGSRKEPGLGYPITFGPWPFVGGALTLVAAGIALRDRDRRTLRPLAALAFGTLFVQLVLMLVVLPTYDAACRAPLRNLAALAVPRLAPGQELVLVGQRHRPSVTYYTGVPTTDVSRAYKWLPALFEGPGDTYGIVSESDLPRLHELGPTEVLAEERGFVLFRCEPLPEADAAAPDR
jgi:4-amino-4-deoxy-L-arabinose transferase-like glycosyltransferase